MYGSCEKSTFSGVPSFDRCARMTPVERMTFIASCAFFRSSAIASMSAFVTFPSP